MIRGLELDRRLAQYDADLIGHARRGIGGEREREPGRDAEDDRRDAIGRDRQQQHEADPPDRRQEEQGDGGREGTDLEGGGEQSVARGADAQYVVREDGQQRRRAAEDHGEEVEAHRAEHDRVREDVAQTFEHRGDGDRALPRGRRPDREEHQQRDRSRDEERAGEIGGGDPECGDDEPGQRGPEREGERTDRRGGRDDARELLHRDEQGQQRRTRRIREGRGGGHDHDRRVEQRGRVGLAAQCEERQRARRCEGGRLGGLDHTPPLVSIRRESGRQRQQEGGEELDETEQAEIEGAARDRVEMPCDRRAEHRAACTRRGEARQIEAEIERHLWLQAGRVPALIRRWAFTRSAVRWSSGRAAQWVGCAEPGSEHGRGASPARDGRRGCARARTHR